MNPGDHKRAWDAATNEARLALQAFIDEDRIFLDLNLEYGAVLSHVEIFDAIDAAKGYPDEP